MKKISLIFMGLVGLLSACATPIKSTSIPTFAPQQTLWFQIDQLDRQGNVQQTSLLSIQGEENGQSRWVQTDIFGAPQARFILKNNKWQKDGFVPPNTMAQHLFEAMFESIQQQIEQAQIIRTPDQQTWQIHLLPHNEETQQ